MRHLRSNHLNYTAGNGNHHISGRYPADPDPPAAGGEIDLAFSASGPWQAEITDGVEWIVLSQAAGEAGEHSLTVTVAENAAPVQRAAEITFTCGISAVTFSITQQTAEI